jgi:hypothetical protein
MTRQPRAKSSQEKYNLADSRIPLLRFIDKLVYQSPRTKDIAKSKQKVVKL